MKWTVSVDQALSNSPSTIKGLPFWNIYLDILLNELQLNLSTAMLRFRLLSWLGSKNIPKRHLHSQSRSSEFLSSTTSHKSHLSKTEPSSREATAPATDPPRCPATTVTAGWISVSDGRTLTPWGFFFFFFLPPITDAESEMNQFELWMLSLLNQIWIQDVRHQSNHCCDFGLTVRGPVIPSMASRTSNIFGESHLLAFPDFPVTL